MRFKSVAVTAVAVGLSLAFTGALVAKGPPAQTGPGLKKKVHRANTIELPGNSVYPEGIAAAGNKIYVGSFLDGTIFSAPRRGKQATILSPAGTDGRTSATGMKVDRNGHLLVAGGATGFVWILDRKTGATLGKLSDKGAYSLGGPTFLNDIVIAKNGDAYVTDSFKAVIFRIPAATLATPPADGALEAWLPLDGTAIVYQDGFNLNGIVAWKNRTLLVVQSNTGKLFRIAIASKTVTEVPVKGTTLTGGDGMVLHDNRLYVVHEGKVDVLQMKKKFSSGRLRKTITDPSFDSPTTAALHRGRLYIVNSQFGKLFATPPVAATTPFTVSVLKPGRGGF